MPESYGDLGLEIPKAKGDPPNGPQEFKNFIDSLEEALAGMIVATMRTDVPDGFLLCDGTAVSRSTYSRLFEAIGTSAGAGNGLTTFNLPDHRGRVLVGVDGTAGRLSANDQLGNVGGEERHVLLPGEAPSHTHSFSGTTGVDSPDHIHEQQVLAPGGGGVGLRRDYGSDGTGTIFQQGVGTKGASNRHAHFYSGITTAAGGGGAHNNMPPYQVVHWLIKY